MYRKPTTQTRSRWALQATHPDGRREVANLHDRDAALAKLEFGFPELTTHQELTEAQYDHIRDLSYKRSAKQLAAMTYLADG
jgi:hypothetical protein